MQTTGTATLVLGKISGYSEWGQEVALRFVTRNVPYDPDHGITQTVKILQQR